MSKCFKYNNNAETYDKFKRNEEKETKRVEEATKEKERERERERGGGKTTDPIESHNHDELHFYCRTEQGSQPKLWKS